MGPDHSFSNVQIGCFSLFLCFYITTTINYLWVLECYKIFYFFIFVFCKKLLCLYLDTQYQVMN